MFKGVFTALVTPFKNQKVDFEALKKLIEFNIKGGVSGLVPCGTTGETPTLSDDEYQNVVRFVVEEVKKRVKVIAGAGSNSTEKTISNVKFVKDAGVDAALIVTPYYNKPTQEGLYRHYEAIADKVNIPQIIYNVPGRTGVNLSPETLERLSKIPLIKGVKEASGNLIQASEMRKIKGELSLLSGDDQLFLPFLALGGDGIISVTSNVIPNEFSKLFELYSKGNISEAKDLFLKVFPLTCDLFLETNPIPVKTALSCMGLIEDEFRLPLCQMGEATFKKLKETLKELKLI